MSNNLPGPRSPSTDWPALVVSMLFPLLAAAGFVFLALQPQWDDSLDWVIGLFILAPLEFVRVLVISILRDSYKDYRNPAYAVRWFLVSIAILATICLGFALYSIGIREVFTALADWQTWRIILPLAGLIVADGFIGLYFFHGNAQMQAARLDALAQDAEDWLIIGGLRLPIAIGLSYGLLLLLRSLEFAIPAWVPNPSSESFRQISQLCGALYFFGKAILVAQVHTAHFNRSGRRLLSAGWIQFIVGSDAETRAKAAKDELRAVEERRRVLAEGQ